MPSQSHGLGSGLRVRGRVGVRPVGGGACLADLSLDGVGLLVHLGKVRVGVAVRVRAGLRVGVRVRVKPRVRSQVTWLNRPSSPINTLLAPAPSANRMSANGMKKR